MSNFFVAGAAAMTSSKDDWETPQWLFDELDSRAWRERDVRNVSTKDLQASSNALRVCPFCGGEAEMIHAVGEWWAICKFCKATTEAHTDKGFAIAAWNTRAERTCEPTESDKCLHGTDCPAWLCSECGELFEQGTNFCSNCGAHVEA